MKVSVITRHAVTNYGSLLQAIATQEIIEQLGHECRIIDYIRNDENYKVREKTLLKNKPAWNRSFIRRILYLALRMPFGFYVGIEFEKERKKFLNLTKRYTNGEELKNDIPKADVYVTGSDQVWGPVECGEHDYSYFLDFTADNDKRISYAASFGRTGFSEEILEQYRYYLLRYDHISVREKSAVELLDKFGLKSEIVLDPTLLFGKEYWKKYFKPIKKNKYVLIYQVNNDPFLGQVAKRVAKENSLPLVRITNAISQVNRPGKLVYSPTIGEFLSYIDNAECLITDSFHATAFAINFNTVFVEVLPNNMTGTRNQSILELTKLSDRIVSNIKDVSIAMKKIDFTEANSIIENLRVSSIEYLKNSIEN